MSLRKGTMNAGWESSTGVHCADLLQVLFLQDDRYDCDGARENTRQPTDQRERIASIGLLDLDWNPDE